MWLICSLIGGLGASLARLGVLSLMHSGDAVVRSSPDRAVRVRALARDIALCSWARHFTLTVPLSTQVYKWVPANLMLEVTLLRTSISSRGSTNILHDRNQDKLRSDGPVDLFVDLTLPYVWKLHSFSTLVLIIKAMIYL